MLLQPPVYNSCKQWLSLSLQRTLPLTIIIFSVYTPFPSSIPLALSFSVCLLSFSLSVEPLSSRHGLDIVRATWSHQTKILSSPQAQDLLPYSLSSP